MDFWSSSLCPSRKDTASHCTNASVTFDKLVMLEKNRDFAVASSMDVAGRYPVDKQLPREAFYFSEDSEWTRERTLYHFVFVPWRSPCQQFCIFRASWNPHAGRGCLDPCAPGPFCFLLCSARHQQLPLASILIFIPENRQRWPFPLCGSCDEAHDDGPKCRRSFQLGGEQQLAPVPWLKCQVTALLYIRCRLQKINAGWFIFCWICLTVNGTVTNLPGAGELRVNPEGLGGGLDSPLRLPCLGEVTYGNLQHYVVAWTLEPECFEASNHPFHKAGSPLNQTSVCTHSCNSPVAWIFYHWRINEWKKDFCFAFCLLFIWSLV